MNSEAKQVRKVYERASGNHKLSRGKRQQQMLKQLQLEAN